MLLEASEIRPLAASFGAEVPGAALRAAADDADSFAALRTLWHQHKLLLFRDLVADEADLVRFSRLFGELEIHVRREYLSADNPEILLVSNQQRDGRDIGILKDREVGWHYDQIYLPKPAVGSLLYAVTVPPEGGNTWFADMGAAYDLLPPDTRAKINGRLAVQSYEHFNRAFSVPTNDEQKRNTPDQHHPLVRTHPYTGRKALYICPGMTTQIVGLDEADSAATLAGLFEWCEQAMFLYQHEWRPGDALLWDNACTMHRRDPFDPGYDRLMKRTTILPDADLAVPF